MEIDKKRALYQHYQKLQDKYENRRLLLGLVKPFFGVIWFLMFLMGFVTVPFLYDRNFYNKDAYKKELFRWDSTNVSSTSKGGEFITYHFTIIKDTLLPIQKRRTTVTTYNNPIFGGTTLREYIESYYSLNPKKDTIDPYTMPIPLWYSEKTKDAEYVQHISSPDEINFTVEKIALTLFTLSFPFLFFVVIPYVKKFNKWKERSENEIKKAYEEWENYSSYR